MTQIPHTPDGLPRLSRGSHLGPQEGACFMEYASVLAGEPFSDQPRCTHPLLAELARMVNDSVSDAGRQRLLPLVPSVIGRTTPDPRAAARLVEALVETATEHGVEGPSLRWHARRARTRLRRVESRGPASAATQWLRDVSDFAYREGPASRAVNSVGFAMAGPPDGHRDERLVALLVTGLAVFAELAPQPDAGSPATQWVPAAPLRPTARPEAGA